MTNTPLIGLRRQFRLDYGIDDIIDAELTEAALPGRSMLLPPALGSDACTTSWEKPFDTTAYLEKSLRPAIADARLLLPSAFSGILSRTLKELNDLMRAGNDRDGSIALAVSVLQEEQELRLLVDEYRNALLQG